MHLKDKKLIENGYEIATFSESLTDEAVIKLGTRFKHSEDMFNKVEMLLEYNDIEIILDNITNIRESYRNYRRDLFEKSRNYE